VNLDHGEPVEQIVAKLPGGHHGAQVTVRSGDHAHIHLAHGRRANTLDFLVLQRAQQLGLRGKRHVPDFIQQQRAAVRVFKQADLVCHRAGKGSLHVAEQLAFKDGFHHRRAVADRKILGGRRAAAVQRPGYQFLAGAGGAGD